MTREEAKELLEQGKRIDEIFPLSEGQDCMIYKGEWSEGDDIIYIPDIELNELDSDLPAGYKVGFMYTGKDFIDEAFGNVKAAEELFNSCDWMNPDIADLFCYTSDEEAKELYGETWEEMERRCNHEDLRNC